MQITVCRMAAIVVGLTLASNELEALAQDEIFPEKSRPRSTILAVEILTGSDGSALHAQSWRAVFEELDIPVTMRRPVLDDKPDLQERVVGTLRYLTIIGKLDRGGDLVFPQKTYRRDEAKALKEWLDELKTYGVQGAPTGKPLWGLSKPQFEGFFNALAAPVESVESGTPLKEAIGKLGLPKAYPVRWSTTAETLVRGRPMKDTRQTIAGLTQATTLAILLNDHGLGFRPNRTPQGTLEIAIEPLTADPVDHWPVGWPIQNKQSPEMFPGLFEMTNIELKPTALADVIDAASELTRTRIYFDFAEMDRRQLDPTALKVTHPLKKTTWSLALRHMLVPQKLNREYWQDEAGHGFVWITPIGKPGRKLEQP